MASNDREQINISNEKYELYDNWINNIAVKYLDVDNINHLKVGLFGYINEILATSLRYNIAHRNFLYDEGFLNTCCLTKSIYNIAKSYNYDIGFATPACCQINFGIKQSDIFTYGTREVDPITNRYIENYTFRISTDDHFFLGNYHFLIEHDIILKAVKQNDGTFSYTASYASDDDNGTYSPRRFSKNTNPYITVWVDRQNYEDLVILQFPIYQAEKNTVTFENFSSDISESLFFNTNYRNDLCSFDVYYKTAKNNIKLTPYFNETFTPDTEYYCYYSFNTNKLTIYFSGIAGSFRPNINSKLLLTMYTTTGTNGNFNYDGTVGFQFNEANKASNIIVQTSLLTSPSEGTNCPTLKELKTDLIYEFLTRDNIVTELDLNNYFNKLIKNSVVNNSEILFIKKRDDIFKRLFAGFLLLKDKTGLIIPSNTVDVDLQPVNMNKEFHLQCGSIILWDDVSQKYVFGNSSEISYFQTVIDDEKIKYKHFDSENNYEDYDLVYRLPYALHYKKVPLPRLLCIQDNFNKNIYFNYSYINASISAEFIINGLNIERSSVTYDRLISDDIDYDTDGNISSRKIIITNGQKKSTFNIVYDEAGDVDQAKSNNMEPIIEEINDINTYFLSFNLNTNLDNKYFFDGGASIEDGSYQLNNNLICRALIYDEKNRPLYYFDFKLQDPESKKYTAKLITDNYYTDDNKIHILQSEENPIYSADIAELADNIFIPENAKIKIALLTKILDINNEPLAVLNAPLKNDIMLSGYTTAVILDGITNFRLFMILNNIMNPDPIIKEIESYNVDIDEDNKILITTASILLQQLPLIGQHYLYNYNVFKDFFTTISIYYDLLMENFDRLGTNTGLNIKFYNTYGISKYFTTKKTDISLNLRIKLSASYTQNLDYEIKNFIVGFIEKINTGTIKTFAVSNLVRELEDAFPDIMYIEFQSLNGDTESQVVSYTAKAYSEMSKEELINYIPEYLNVHINKDAYISGKENFSTGIHLEYI